MKKKYRNRFRILKTFPTRQRITYPKLQFNRKQKQKSEIEAGCTVRNIAKTQKLPLIFFWTISDFYYFDFYGKQLIKIISYRFYQKIRFNRNLRSSKMFFFSIWRLVTKFHQILFRNFFFEYRLLVQSLPGCLGWVLPHASFE